MTPGLSDSFILHSAAASSNANFAQEALNLGKFRKASEPIAQAMLNSPICASAGQLSKFANADWRFRSTSLSARRLAIKSSIAELDNSNSVSGSQAWNPR